MNKPQSLFGKDPQFNPLYTTVEIVPEELDYQLGVINQMSDDEFIKYAESLRKYFLYLYEQKNFPIGTKGKRFDKIVNDLRKFNDYPITDVLSKDELGEENIICSFNKWPSAVNHWFPEMYDTIIGSTKASIIGQLRDPQKFLKNLHGIVKKDQFSFRKTDKFGLLSKYIASGFRVINGNQPAVNFPAGIAKFIYLTRFNEPKYRKRKNLYILDQCMGWGGRLLGLLSAASNEYLCDKTIHYYGTDVNTATHERFEMILDFWKEYINPKINFKLYKVTLPAEDLLNDKTFSDMKDTFDMSLTSPPYFNREQYSDDDTQSFKRYSNYNLWRDGFLYHTIKNTVYLLRPDSKMYWNIADIKISSSKDESKAYLPLERDSINIAKQFNMEHIKTYKMLMSSMVGISRVDGQKVLGKNRVEVKDRIYKFEPIFVLKKKL